MQHVLMREYNTYLDDNTDSMSLFFFYSTYLKEKQEKKQAQELAGNKRGTVKMPNRFG